MAILEFECTGNERLALLGIKSFKLTPDNKLQLLLGTNGSGKSVIMGELSPLAAVPGAYNDDGYKRLLRAYKGSIYECISDFTGVKNHFELRKDSNVIYQGHSSEAYNAHVFEHFGMTKELHEIRTGKRKLSTMSVDERRKWFTRLCPTDFTYSIGYYKRLTESTKYISENIKRLNTKLMQEKSKLIDPDTEASMRSEIKSLNKQKSEMMQHWRPMENSVDSILDGVADIDKELDSLCDGFTKSLSIFCNIKGYKSQDDIWKDIADAQGQLSFVSSKLSEIFEEIESNRELVDKAREAMSKDIGQISSDLAEVSRQISLTKLSISTGDEWAVSPSETLVAYDTVYPVLIQALHELVPDPGLIYTNSLYAEAVSRIEQLNKSIESMERDSIRLSEQISLMEHQKLSSHVECPKCEHSWFKGFSEDDYANLKQAHEQLTLKLTESKTELESLSEVQEVRARQLSLYQHIVRTASVHTNLRPMLVGLQTKQFINHNPQGALEYVKAIRREIEANILLQELKEKRDSLAVAKKTAAEMSGIGQQDLIDKNEALEAKFVLLQKESIYLTSLVSGLQKAQKAMDYQEKYIPAVDLLMMKRSEMLTKAEVANHHTVINSIIMEIDNQISTKERLINQIDNQHILIHNLETEVSDNQKKEEYLKKAVKILSPSKGLIAKGLTGFINHFIAQMNAIIQKAWLYPLVISPVKMTEDDGVVLDYNFAFTVNDKKAGLDVKDGSGAQGEIFDLAFMLVSLSHLGMDDTEIFLDEFAIRMDVAHRKEAMKMVVDLLTTSNFSQIFMISHYESTYSSLKDADITILCDDNVELPSTLIYNNRAEIKR